MKPKANLLATMSIVALFFFTTVHAANVEKELFLYIDADFTNASASSLSIEQGVLTALSEIDNSIDGYQISVKRKDHRGNTRRSLDNLHDYLEDDKALAVFGGLHSPPLLANREFINTKKILTLSPWAAAGPITRYPSPENWIFRLSVDDTKAGNVMVDYTIKKIGARHPALLLEKTGWGVSNQKTMMRALTEHGLSPSGIYWFNWGLQDRGSRILLRTILESNADAILLVANTPEAKSICRALAELQTDTILPVVSHWGLTGGDFPDVISAEQREKIHLSFLQTSFSFLSEKQDKFSQQVFKRAEELFPNELKEVTDIKAPTGFIHGYDLTRVLIAAMKQASLTGVVTLDRLHIRDELENIKTPIRGLIKTYIKPFQPFGSNAPDGHEALGIEDLVMARYNKNNHIVLEQ